MMLRSADCTVSPSLRGSGLKLTTSLYLLTTHKVSLFTREWIEICHFNYLFLSFRCLPLYEGVDWNRGIISISIRCEIVSLFTREWIEIGWQELMRGIDKGLPLYEGVDWNYSVDPDKPYEIVSLFTREWIEINGGVTVIAECHRLPLYEGVDWNCFSVYRAEHKRYVSLFTREWIEIFLLQCFVK